MTSNSVSPAAPLTPTPSLTSLVERTTPRRLNIGGTADVTLPAFPTARGAGATATINFDGGTLKNLVASTTYMSGLTNAFIKSGGAKFDTTAGDITVAQPLLTDLISTGGGLTKIGANTLTLTGANTYTGGTTLNQGTLTIGRAAHSEPLQARCRSIIPTALTPEPQQSSIWLLLWIPRQVV